jgi:hypothetical protein
MKIIAFDPGGETGWAKYQLTDRGRSIIKGEVTYDDHHAWLYDELHFFAPQLVLTERFDYRRKQQNVELISKEYIGVMRLWCNKYDVELVEQTQLKGKKGLWTDDKLKVLGLHTPSKGGHANDAVRQLLYFITTELDDYFFIHRYRSLKES